MKFKAKDILEKAGYEPASKIGKVRVRIGGVSVNDPEHIINVQDAKEVDILVGIETQTVSL